MGAGEPGTAGDGGQRELDLVLPQPRLGQPGLAGGGKGIVPQYTAAGGGALYDQGVPRAAGQLRGLGRHPSHMEPSAKTRQQNQ